jgi:hypothetical protein
VLPIERGGEHGSHDVVERALRDARAFGLREMARVRPRLGRALGAAAGYGGAASGALQGT